MIHTSVFWSATSEMDAQPIHSDRPEFLKGFVASEQPNLVCAYFNGSVSAKMKQTKIRSFLRVNWAFLYFPSRVSHLLVDCFLSHQWCDVNFNLLRIQIFKWWTWLFWQWLFSSLSLDLEYLEIACQYYSVSYYTSYSCYIRYRCVCLRCVRYTFLQYFSIRLVLIWADNWC